MANEKRLIDAYEFYKKFVNTHTIPVGEQRYVATWRISDLIADAPTVDAISISDIYAYLQARLDEWNALGDRKWEPANMWGYNFIMACFDDLEAYGERKE